MRSHLFAMGAMLCLTSSLVLGGVIPAVAAQSTEKAPDFIVNNTGWTAVFAKNFETPPAGFPSTGGIGPHPDYPNFGNETGHPTPRIGNYTSPILLPWAAEQLKKTDAAILAGGVPFDPAARCWPAGVPAVATFGVEPVYFIPTPTEVLIIYQRGQIVRHVYMNQPHSARPAPSWYGESVGHYEGDTFVVDTIGMNDKSFVDIYNTPHTTALHVVERYRTVDNPDGKSGKLLQDVFTVDDPGTFTKPWAAMKTFRPQSNRIEESLCQVGNDDIFNQGIRPVPTAAKPDF